MPQGTAKDVGTDWWLIVDAGDNELVRFDHQDFPNIRNGATVTFVDADGNGIAENVQPAVAVERYMERAARAGTICDLQSTVFYTIMAELHQAADEAGSDRRKRLRRLREALDAGGF